MSSKLFVTDIHLEDKLDAEYRFRIFEFLKEIISQYDIEHIFFLGDTCDKKDRHRGAFLNRIKDNFIDLVDSTKVDVTILLGNHDVMPGSYPSLKFLDDVHPSLSFVTEYEELQLSDGTKFALVPHCMYDEITYDNWWSWAKESDCNYILAHETFSSAVESNGFELAGPEIPSDLSDDVFIISGDVHVPQYIGNVIYVGSPYPIKFGDTFKPRCLLIDSYGEFKSIDPTDESIPNRFSIKVNNTNELREFLEKNAKEDDQVKIQITINTDRVAEWSSIKDTAQQICDEYKVEVFGIEVIEQTESQPIKEVKFNAQSNLDYFKYFCEQEGITGELHEVGEEIMYG